MLIFKLIHERFPVSISEIDKMDFFRFETLIETLIEYNQEAKAKSGNSMDVKKMKIDI